MDEIFNNSDDFQDIDFDFKAITPGLGFDHGKKTHNQVKKMAGTIKKQNKNINTINKKNIDISNFDQIQTTYKSDLDYFYRTVEDDLNRNDYLLPNDLSGKKEKSKEIFISSYIQLCSEIIDLLFCLFMTVVISVICMVINFEILANFNLLKWLLNIKLLYLFIPFYLLYMGLLETLQYKTLGKLIFSIKATSKWEKGNGNFISVSKRSLLNLISLVFIGIPILLKLPQRILGFRQILE